MLHRLLKTIRSGEMLSLLEIAHSMDVSPDMVLLMAKELTNKGYLQEISSGCAQPQKGCPDCPVASPCQESVRHWFLTEKGRAASDMTVDE